MMLYPLLVLLVAGITLGIPESAVRQTVVAVFGNIGTGLSETVDLKRKITRETRSVARQNMLFERAVRELVKTHRLERREAARLVESTLQDLKNDLNFLEAEQEKVKMICGSQLVDQTHSLKSSSGIRGLVPSGFPGSSLGTCSVGSSCKDSRNCKSECLCGGGFPVAGNIQKGNIPHSCLDRDINCDPLKKFYSIDGTCNNLENVLWGATVTRFRRLLPAEYGPDNAPRGGSDDLPNARLVSVGLFHDVENPNTRYTHMVAQQGQFLDHDITLTPGCDQNCCQKTLNKIQGYGGIPEEKSCEREECFPIKVALDDPFYSNRKLPVTCLDFSRSSAFCFQEPREQFNAITAFIDGSNVYGSDITTATKLRASSGGKMLTRNNMLPVLEGVFTAGDIRAIEQPGLASMHTVWLREHNRIAGGMSGSHEEIYQKSRKMVIAEMQNIVYNEWLPTILGPNFINVHHLNANVQCTLYNSTVDPSIFNSFATSAFRFGHSLLQGLVAVVSNSNRRGTYGLKDNFLNPSKYLSDMDGILKGLAMQNVQSGEEHATEHVTNFLFKETSNDFGSDLIARNIQRGRDHGLPGYLKFRGVCQLQEDLSDIASAKRIKLTAMYDSIGDIDLFVGGLMEEPVPDGLVGPTFACILGRQFKNLMDGDRFFFTHVQQVGQLTSSEFSWVKSRTLRDVLCDNTKIDTLQKNVFKVVDANTNPLSNCPSRQIPTRGFSLQAATTTPLSIFSFDNVNPLSIRAKP